jgi:anti-sigma B factor antagonist
MATPAEIDVANAGRIHDQLLTVLAREPVTVIVDMTATVFCDSAGMNAVLRAYKRAIVQGAELRLVIPARAVRRVFTITGLDRLVDIYPSLAASLAGKLAGEPVNPGASPAAADTGLAVDTGPGLAGPAAHAGCPPGSGGQ